MMMLTPQEVHRADVAHSQALLKIEQLEETLATALARELEAGLATTEKERTALREALVGLIDEVIMGDPDRIRMAVTVSHGLLEIVPAALAGES